MRRATRVALLALLLTAGASEAAPARAQEMFGVSVNRVFNDHFDEPAYIDAQLDAVQAAGIDAARSDAFWEWAERSAPASGASHAYDWGMHDRVAEALALHGLRWLPILDYSAPWAAAEPGNAHSPPASNDDFAAFAGAFAARYGRQGTFWAEHPDLTPLPVTAYEVWNEPNGAWFWQPAPDPARYADMYLKSRAAIHAADPAATAVVGGLVPDTAYLQAMYAARPELRGQVDAVGWHPYAASAAGVIAHVRALRRTLDGLGEPLVPIHVTEVGWPTSGSGSSIVITETARTEAIEAVTDSLARSDCGVSAIVPYTWTTPEQDLNDIEDWYGLSATPSRDAYAHVVARWRSEPPGDAPRQRLCHPPDADADGQPDAEDPDDDGDGVPDAADPFPLDAHERVDTDGDGSGDTADLDDDGDGRLDALDTFPLDPLEKDDADLDGTGDRADADDDNDGLTDAEEGIRRSSPTDLDSDDDGLPDPAEVRTSPARADSDRDRIADGTEAGVSVPVPDPPGTVTGTAPSSFRPDGDPRTRTSTVRRDTDRDGLRDSREDRDRDGRRDRGETDPRTRDSDRDGVGDRRDRRPLDRWRH